MGMIGKRARKIDLPGFSWFHVLASVFAEIQEYKAHENKNEDGLLERGNFWVGKLLEHPDIMTQGETLKELEENILAKILHIKR